ncbi:hypothetical protein BDZ89DRAFT_893613, partial [Hymenopellis radicata]
LESTTSLTICISSAVFATTIHVQDFRDIKGDTRLGRRTLPIVFPAGARETVTFTLLSWSIFLAHFWQLRPAIAVFLTGFAGYVGGRLITYRTSIEADEWSYYWYNV